MLLPSRTPVTDGGGIVRRVPSRAISPLLVPAIIAQITGTSALILIAISASGPVLTNVMATTATGNDAIGLSIFGPRADILNFIRNVCQGCGQMRHLLRSYDSRNIHALLNCDSDFCSLLRGQGDGRWRALRKLRPHSF